jgi:hypothetical protein
MMIVGCMRNSSFGNGRKKLLSFNFSFLIRMLWNLKNWLILLIIVMRHESLDYYDGLFQVIFEVKIKIVIFNWDMYLFSAMIMNSTLIKEL